MALRDTAQKVRAVLWVGRVVFGVVQVAWWRATAAMTCGLFLSWLIMC